jgi:hypothetical protein
MDRVENVASKNSSIVASVFVAAATFLPSRCISRIVGYTDRWKGFMKYADVMGSGVMIYIPCFIKTGSAIQKLLGRGDT